MDVAETTTEATGMRGVWHVRMGAGAAWRKTVWGELSEGMGWPFSLNDSVLARVGSPTPPSLESTSEE